MSRWNLPLIAALLFSLQAQAADPVAAPPAGGQDSPASAPVSDPAFAAPVVAPAPVSPTAPASPDAPAASSGPAEETAYPVGDRIAAVGHTKVIPLNELNDRTDFISLRLSKQGVPLPNRSILMHQVLERMILDSIETQYAQDEGITVDDAQLDMAIERVAEQNKLSLSAFRAEVEKDGVAWNHFREDIRSEIVLARLREREVDSRVTVTDNEVDAQLQEEKTLGSSAQDEFDLAHILVVVPDGATESVIEDKHKKIQAALDQLNRGADFAQVAAIYSEAPDALKGGNLGWRSAARLPNLFADAVSRLKPGEYSDILRSPNGFHIIKLLKKRGAGEAGTSTQYHVRQILVKISPDESPGEAQNKIDTISARLKAGEDFAKVATISSEDESRNRGGDLGWISEGATLPQFESVVKSLKPGEISAPFQTPLGWHIVQLVEVRDAGNNDEGRRMAVRQALKARKADKAFDEWIRQLRGQAYVDNRLEEK